MKRSNNKGTLVLKGNLFSDGDIQAETIKVGNELSIMANLEAEKIIVGKDCKVTGNITTTKLLVNENCKIGGNLVCKEAGISGKCQISGDAECEWEMMANSLEVSGNIKCNNMIIKEDCKAKTITCSFTQVMGNIVAEKIDTNGGCIYCGGSVTGEIVGNGEVYEYFKGWGNI